MQTPRHLLPAVVLCLMASPAHGATLSFVSAFRHLESGSTIRRPPAEFADFDDTIVVMVEEPGGIPRAASSASQRSAFRSDSITVSSRIFGDAGRGTSLFHVTFSLEESAPFSLTGAFNLLGTTGFACVSMVNLAHHDLLLINEIISAPPFVSETRVLSFAGMLEAGSYTMEAMIYGGGDNQPTQGGLDVALFIPEPGSALLAATAIVLMARRRCPAIRIPPADSRIAGVLPRKTGRRSVRFPAR